MAMEKTKLDILQHLGFLPKIDEVSFYQDQIILVKVGHCVTNTFGHQHPSPISRLLIFPQCGLTKINETIRNEIKSEMIFNMESAPSISEQSCFARNVERYGRSLRQLKKSSKDVIMTIYGVYLTENTAQIFFIQIAE